MYLSLTSNGFLVCSVVPTFIFHLILYDFSSNLSVYIQVTIANNTTHVEADRTSLKAVRDWLV